MCYDLFRSGYVVKISEEGNPTKFVSNDLLGL